LKMNSSMRYLEPTLNFLYDTSICLLQMHRWHETEHKPPFTHTQRCIQGFSSNKISTKVFIKNRWPRAI